MIELTTGELARMLAKIDQGEDCWLWTGETNSQGYGRFAIYRGPRRHRVLVHRVVHRFDTGQLPAVVRHTCDTPLCARPEHLVGGTQADNIRDAITRGRHNAAGLVAWRAFMAQLPTQRAQSGWKQCSKCRTAKPLSGFHRNAQAADGYQYWCASCCVEHQRTHRTRKPATGGSAAKGVAA